MIDHTPLKELKVGDKIEVLEDTSCLHKGEIKIIKEDAKKELFISCTEGMHYLEIGETFTNPMVKLQK